MLIHRQALPAQPLDANAIAAFERDGFVVARGVVPPEELVQVDPGALATEALAERLSIAGFEVEAIEDLSARAAGVVVGFVEQRDPHPNADKLSVCRVQIGAAEPLQIVCGAANVRAGIHVPVATVGAAGRPPRRPPSRHTTGPEPHE
jgi:hypothetical protein